MKKKINQAREFFGGVKNCDVSNMKFKCRFHKLRKKKQAAVRVTVRYCIWNGEHREKLVFYFCIRHFKKIFHNYTYEYKCKNCGDHLKCYLEETLFSRKLKRDKKSVEDVDNADDLELVME